MQDLASKFSKKISGGNICGRARARRWNQNLGPPQLFSRDCASSLYNKKCPREPRVSTNVFVNDCGHRLKPCACTAAVLSFKR